VITADNITDEEIKRLMRHASKTAGVGASDRVFSDCNTALSAPVGSLRRVQARARCAEFLNALEKCRE
jgi:hypothetical protein